MGGSHDTLDIVERDQQEWSSWRSRCFCKHWICIWPCFEACNQFPRVGIDNNCQLEGTRNQLENKLWPVPVKKVLDWGNWSRKTHTECGCTKGWGLRLNKTEKPCRTPEFVSLFPCCRRGVNSHHRLLSHDGLYPQSVSHSKPPNKNRHTTIMVTMKMISKWQPVNGYCRVFCHSKETSNCDNRK